jgi:hypothetical protein
MEESKMRFNWKTIRMALTAFVLLGGGTVYATPSAALASPIDSAYASERASRLLTEIQAETVDLRINAEKLHSLSRHPQYSWQSHADFLHEVKTHINSIGDRTAELQRIQSATLPWQQQAIREVTSHAAKVANSTQAAIVYLNDNHRLLFAPEYKDQVTSIADSSQNMKQTVDKFLEYEKAKQKFQRLQTELELSVD